MGRRRPRAGGAERGVVHICRQRARNGQGAGRKRSLRPRHISDYCVSRRQQRRLRSCMSYPVHGPFRSTRAWSGPARCWTCRPGRRLDWSGSGRLPPAITANQLAAARDPLLATRLLLAGDLVKQSTNSRHAKNHSGNGWFSEHPLLHRQLFGRATRKSPGDNSGRHSGCRPPPWIRLGRLFDGCGRILSVD